MFLVCAVLLFRNVFEMVLKGFFGIGTGFWARVGGCLGWRGWVFGMEGVDFLGRGR